LASGKYSAARSSAVKSGTLGLFQQGIRGIKYMIDNKNETSIILLADDDENDVVLFQRAIKASGLSFEIKTVHDGEQAIKYLQRVEPYADPEAFPTPRFLILDLKMPRKTGFDVLQWLVDHPECKVTPTIAFSSSSIPSDIVKAYQLGANTFFTKPNDFNELKVVFQMIIDYWSKANVPPIPSA
jgi:CheY-like chemotaxis protein